MDDLELLSSISIYVLISLISLFITHVTIGQGLPKSHYM